MNSLGEVLQQKGWVTREQLARALERQQQLGGRLGTCLLEIGAIGQDRLLEALAAQLGVPAVKEADLASIEPAALALLPAETALTNRAIVFRAAGNRADVAMLDIGDLALEDELSFVVGRRVTFYISTELMLLQSLARHYDYELPARFSSLARRLARSRERSEAAPSDPSGAVSPVAAARNEPAASPVRNDDTATAPRQAAVIAPLLITLTAEERAALAAVRTSPARADGSALEPESVLGTRLARAETASAIGQELLGALSEHFVRVLLFRVSGSRQEVSGWCAIGPKIDKEWFENYSVGLHQATVFRQLLTTKSLFVGSLEVHPGHNALARCWGGSLEHECMLVPVFVRGHLACVAYGDRDSLGVTGVDLVLMQRYADKAAIAFERCILRHKLQADS
jgi:hypothetical protein